MRVPFSRKRGLLLFSQDSGSNTDACVKKAMIVIRPPRLDDRPKIAVFTFEPPLVLS
jgi:hypothetical protein